jgi:hypothetical protein
MSTNTAPSCFNNTGYDYITNSCINCSISNCLTCNNINVHVCIYCAYGYGVKGTQCVQCYNTLNYVQIVHIIGFHVKHVLMDMDGYHMVIIYVSHVL